ncbi:ABC-type polysaccharide/polyol phosphate transport system, ATPase component [Belliella baltica DSM 15883]|uniref:ABC-type polysaccharide/polyol phosphate transport system, ATPase component n=1 Tax=Belliella baltica (strain DSM 15883 / CIP 108006 / LMG 21964 / BA134) TaxID=866536 RepID=I3Z752_BELBD|nr:ABC transporter ATP-binding protein [Belliella baltica]AFL85070.1 ABC-type polysaccharide/polyol phosphate transport system, ATPase component [Belliella baltica DSM 15883]
MSQSIIKVQNISKRYRLGLKEKQADTLIGQLTNIIKSPYENYKRLRQLSKFGEEADESVFWALKDINFEVQQGEVLGIIGKNGAGKSTLLKILSQITEPTSGKIEIHGRVASLLEVGTGFHPELSGRENIYMNGTILGMTRREIDKKLDEIIDFSGVEKFIDTPVKFYSSGMKVRLGFSVAAHLDPEILIIDEVLAVGDYEFQQKCLGKMEDVSKNQGRTVLFVSHNMGAVQKLCSKAILLDNGSISINGNTKRVIDKYFNLNEIISSYENFNDENKTEYWISSIYLNDDNGYSKNIFNHNEPIFININIEFKYIPNKIFLLVTILDLKSNKIFSAEHIIGDKKLNLRINKNFLTRGDYLIQTIIYKPGVTQFELIEKALSFSVVDAGSEFSHLETFDYGYVFGNYNWLKHD